MSYDIGPKIGIDGEAEFRKQLREINASVKTLGTEMAAVTTAFIGQEKSEKALTAQNDVLERTVLSLNDKLELQKKMLAESAAAYGEADEKTMKWQQAVNATQAELNKANAQIRANDEALEENGDTVEETAEKHESAMSRIASATKAAMKVAGAALTAGAGAIAAIAKQSLGAYGEYEQLMGGVETLFGAGGQSLEEYAKAQGKTVAEVEKNYTQLMSAQTKVLRNADQAYKTAGLGANEYIETVTSFSAALIASLDGDTAKAADVADRAITDMADNTNKLGSSMESIQNAYQGFAKQNYTMLDNLKLGYGGTKEEMQRLLEDAGKLANTKFDISSYADIVEAIHVVQTEMGITGTTAKEASETIQGSVAAMGSAWSNLVAGLGNDTADMDALIGNFVESLTTMLGNVLPRFQKILSGIGRAVQELAPMLVAIIPGVVSDVLPSMLDAGTSLIEGLAKGLLEALPVLVPVALDAMGTLTTSLMDLLPQLMDTALQIIQTLADDLVKSLPTLIPAAVDMILTLVDTLIDNVDQLIDPAIQIIMALAEGLIAALPQLLEKAPVIISKLIAAIVENLSKLLEAAAQMVGTLVLGIIENLPEIGKAAGEIITAFVAGVVDLMVKIWDVGGQIVSGLWNGIKEKAAWLKEKVTGFFGGIVDGVKGFLGIHSPSRVFAGIGGNMAAGLGAGWDKEMAGIRRDIEGSMAFDVPAIRSNLSMPGLTAGSNLSNSDTDAAAPGAMNGSVPAGGEIIINITETLDGAVIARNQYRYNQGEIVRHGDPLVKGV